METCFLQGLWIGIWVGIWVGMFLLTTILVVRKHFVNIKDAKRSDEE